MPKTANTTTVIEAAVADLVVSLPAGAVVAVVVELPGKRYSVGAPADQNPAATYGMFHSVLDHRS